MEHLRTVNLSDESAGGMFVVGRAGLVTVHAYAYCRAVAHGRCDDLTRERTANIERDHPRRDKADVPDLRLPKAAEQSAVGIPVIVRPSWHHVADGVSIPLEDTKERIISVVVVIV